MTRCLAGKKRLTPLSAHRDAVHQSAAAAIAQLGERQTEDLKVPSSILGGGKELFLFARRAGTMRCSFILHRQHGRVVKAID